MLFSFFPKNERPHFSKHAYLQICTYAQLGFDLFRLAHHKSLGPGLFGLLSAAETYCLFSNLDFGHPQPFYK